MTIIDAYQMDVTTLNLKIRESTQDVLIKNCLGQRYIASAMSDKTITIHSLPGNALGAYLDGAHIFVQGNGQDAVGDTMNDGMIVINGSVGDALGYSMRGGKIFVRGSSGYRTGIHMKEYQNKKPAIVIGESCGSFLGEYMAGGIIVVLGLRGEKNIVGNFTGTGMHGGKIYLRTSTPPPSLPAQVLSRKADTQDKYAIKSLIDAFCLQFQLNSDTIYDSDFYVLEPNAKNPYHRLYTPN